MAQAPVPSISLRQRPRGGEVLSAAEPNPPDVLARSWALVLLVHGYNNDLQAARDAYEGFRLVQRGLGRTAPDQPPTRTPLVDVYWPGDIDWGIVSALFYPFSIDRAKQSAAVLAQALGDAARMSGLKQIDIVAHSLGNRLVLELLKQLRNQPGVLVRRIAFMAAAVSTAVLEAGDAHGLRAAYDTAVPHGAISLYSPDDRVLSFAFPLGQTLGGVGESVLPVALGHEKWASPLAPASLRQEHVAGADHSDYWGWQGKTRDMARDAGRRVREFLDLGTLPARSVGDRPRLERAGPALREAGVARTTPTRDGGR